MDEVIDINTLRQSIMNEIANIDRLRGQVRDSRALVTLDQQSVGRLLRMDAMQQQAMHIANDARRQQRHTALLARGSQKTCPRCGKGPLLTDYLKPRASCSACKEDFGRSDVVPLWLATMILAVVTVIGVYFILQRSKGILIALI